MRLRLPVARQPALLGAHELGLVDATDERLLVAAEAACAEGDTMANMPFEVTPDDVVAAMKAADRFSKTLA